MEIIRTKTKKSPKIFKRILIGLSIILLICISVFVIAGMMPSKNPATAAGYKHIQASYVTMKDGTKIAVTVTLPLNLQKDEKIPSIIDWTVKSSHA